MMKYLLKRVAYANYDSFVERILNSLPNVTNDLFIDLEELLEEVVVNGSNVEFEVDDESMSLIIEDVFENNNSNPRQSIDIKLSKILYESLTLDAGIPTNCLYEKEVWAYLNCYVFFDIVKRRFFRDGWDLNNAKRILRVLLSDCTTIDRTGLRWLWSLADATYSPEYLFSLTETSLRFIDPVKALYESALGNNRTLFQAFIRSIQLANYDQRIRSSKYRSILVTHIRNLATMKIYESCNDIEELAHIFLEDIKLFLGDSIDEELEFTEDQEDD